MIYSKKDLQFRILLFSFLIVSSFSCKNETKTSAEKKDASSTQKPEKPNFLVIIADDAGWNDMSFHGSEIQTPNLDKLATSGTQLERFYVNPTCSPSRASLLTGMPASRMGIVAPISGRSEKTLPDSIITLPQALKKANYQTALMGKWHLGLTPASGPEAYGFDYSYGFLHGQIDQYSHEYKNGDPSWHRQGKLIEEEGHATDLITQEAVKWLSEQKENQQFFLQLAYSAPHIPLQEPEKWIEKYSFIENKSRRDYAAAMAHLDEAIGQVLQHLDSLGLKENTIVLFMSDNGAQESWNPTTQYDGKYGPNDQLGSNHISVTDVMPTFLELAAVEIPEQVEGESLTSILKDKTDENHDIYVRGHKQESFIQKPWKLVRTRHLDAETEFELFNIEEDPSEEKNVIAEYQDIANKLKEAIQQQFNRDANEVNVPLLR